MTTKTIPGGAYKLPSGQWVNAYGEKIKEPKEIPSILDDEPEISLELGETGSEDEGEEELTAKPLTAKAKREAKSQARAQAKARAADQKSLFGGG